jgi:hypothetical protein
LKVPTNTSLASGLASSISDLSKEILISEPSIVSASAISIPVVSASIFIPVVAPIA